MLNILIPMVGPNRFDAEEFPYPKPLIEVNGRALIEYVVDCLLKIDGNRRFIFVINASDRSVYHLDKVLKLIGGEDAVVIESSGQTKGAACTALLAIEQIDNAQPLLISSSDHYFSCHLGEVVSRLRTQDCDAGVVCFSAVHPKWSFVRLEEDRVVEAAEKRPLSKHAIAGLYYFRHGRDFVQACMRMIEKRVVVGTEELYYLAPTLNELILEQKVVRAIHIDGSTYHNIYSPQKLREFEELVRGNAK